MPKPHLRGPEIVFFLKYRLAFRTKLSKPSQPNKIYQTETYQVKHTKPSKIWTLNELLIWYAQESKRNQPLVPLCLWQCLLPGHYWYNHGVWRSQLHKAGCKSCQSCQQLVKDVKTSKSNQGFSSDNPCLARYVWAACVAALYLILRARECYQSCQYLTKAVRGAVDLLTTSTYNWSQLMVPLPLIDQHIKKAIVHKKKG